MQFYLYGLVWDSPIFVPAIAPAASRPADVQVSFGTCTPHNDTTLTPVGPSTASGPFRAVAAHKVVLTLPGVARMRIENGCSITIDPAPQADHNALWMMLIGQASAMLLHQRQYLPFHASGVVINGKALLFAGHSGAGKSTLVNALMQRGYPMLCEDLAAIRIDESGQPWVETGVHTTKLWADSAGKLGVATEGLPRVRAELEKFIAPAPLNAAESAPLSCVYALSSHNQPVIQLTPLTDGRKFNALLDHTWQKMALKRMGLHAAHFKRVATIAARTRISRIHRPTEEFLLDELVDTILKDQP